MNILKWVFTTASGPGCVCMCKNFISNNHVSLFVHSEQLGMLGTVYHG